MSFSPDGRQIAVDTLNQIVIFDVQSCRELRRIRAHKSTVKSLAWSPNGQWIASASADRTVRLWTPAGELAGTLTGHRHTASAVAFSPDSSVLISGDQVGSVRFTHVATRRELFTLPTESTYIRQLISLPDNRRIAIRGMHYDIAIIGWPTREKATEPRAAE
jgi:WD40 repeat protein